MSFKVSFLFLVSSFRFNNLVAVLIFGWVCSSCDTQTTQAKKNNQTAIIPSLKNDSVKRTSEVKKVPTVPPTEKPQSSNGNKKVPASKTTDSLKVKTSALVGPDTLPGSILPAKRIIAFYGNPLSKRMGIMGELPASEMLSKLDKEVEAWQKADPGTPIQPALHLIAVTAQSQPGKGNKYRLRMANHVIDTVLARAQKRNALVFLDIQVGRSTLQEELPLLEPYFKLPNVHLGIDAEFSMKGNGVPGRRVGTYDAADINYASQFLADIAKQNQLPPKLLIVHRFTQRMITNYKNIKLTPYCQIVMHMDGWGSPSLKKGTYNNYIKREPVQYTGFKIFYKNDLKKRGGRLMKPKEILALNPTPLYIQYQ